MRKRQRLSYREMTDDEWYKAMQKAEKEQFKYDYNPSPEVLKLHSTRTHCYKSGINDSEIFGELAFTEHDYATSQSCESSLFI